MEDLDGQEDEPPRCPQAAAKSRLLFHAFQILLILGLGDGKGDDGGHIFHVVMRSLGDFVCDINDQSFCGYIDAYASG